MSGGQILSNKSQSTSRLRSNRGIRPLRSLFDIPGATSCHPATAWKDTKHSPHCPRCQRKEGLQKKIAFKGRLNARFKSLPLGAIVLPVITCKRGTETINTTTKTEKYRERQPARPWPNTRPTIVRHAVHLRPPSNCKTQAG